MEVESLDHDLPEDIKVLPRSTLTSPEGVRASTIDFRIERKETYRIVRFDPSVPGWVTVTDGTAEDYDADEIEAAVDEWAQETYGEEDVGYDSMSELLEE